nr:hypothetical protein [Tanacetum cinerariifolium]
MSQLGMDNEEMEEGRIDDEGMEIRDDKQRKTCNVSEMFLELINAKLSKNSSKNIGLDKNLLEGPIPAKLHVEEGKDFGTNINVSDMNNGSKDVNGSLRDVDMQENSATKKPMSFSRVVQGESASGNNKLWLIPCALNNKGRKVVEIDPKPLFVQKWVANICLKKVELARIPLWVKIYNVPLEAWNVDGISRIASRIGTPIIMDKVTTSMCDRRYGRASFGRVLIKVDAANGIIDKVKLWYKNLNRKSNEKAGGKIYADSANVRDWQSIPNRRVNRSGVISSNDLPRQFVPSSSYSYRGGLNFGRGGFSNIGMGGMNGRGLGSVGPMSNGKKNVSVREDVQGQENTQKKKSNDDNNVKFIARRDFSTKNIFSILAEVEEEDMANEERGIKANIDGKRKLLINKIRILEGDISLRRENIKFKSQKVANEGVVYEMENTSDTREQAFGAVYDEAYRKELELIHDLTLKKQLTKVEVFVLSSLPLTNAVRESWTNEMVEFYKDKLNDNGQDGSVVNKGIIFEGFMDDEVGRDTSAHENFITQNNVSICVDATMADTIGSFDAGSDKLKQWDILSEHISVTDSHPWTILGDFTVIMYADEHSKGSIDNYHGVKEFRGCMKHIDMEELVMNGLFFTRVQKIKDPKNGIMKKLDRIMGNNEFLDQFENCYATILPYITFDHYLCLLTIPNVAVKRKKYFRLKSMKQHLRSLNKKNGNVYDKVKRLRDDLKRIQCELDRKPINVKLKEKEMVLNGAYKEAVLDEERVLKQKTKSRIISVRDEMGNVYQDEEVVREFVSHFQSFLGMCDEVFPIDEPDVLFSNKLDPVITLVMVREIYDAEIRAYDIVSWEFLKCSLLKFGFHKKMIEWIMVCLNSTSFSICVNGESRGFFKAKRGLRQGDHVSPYLFTLVMEVFTLMLRRHVKKEKNFKYHWGCKRGNILNLCLADDLMLYCHSDVISASVLRGALDEFCLSSGLRPNMAKSIVFFGNVNEDVKMNIKNVMSFSKGMLSVRYLGIMLDSNRISKNDCKVLLDNGICEDVDKLLKNFLWRNEEGKSCKYSVAWKEHKMDLKDKVAELIYNGISKWHGGGMRSIVKLHSPLGFLSKGIDINIPLLLLLLRSFRSNLGKDEPRSYKGYGLVRRQFKTRNGIQENSECGDVLLCIDWSQCITVIQNGASSSIVVDEGVPVVSAGIETVARSTLDMTH